ncbi:MAG TPA: asparagine--tRNA ligase [Candidatus Thermoplasmatota archaeon]|nr:asparagine--tRNA ligase [Candidatus Thermoplasmatota archaeon]
MPHHRATIASILAGDHTGKTVQVRGWIHRHRTSGKIVFAVVRDATGVLQVTARKGNLPDPDFEAAAAASMEASIIVEGDVAKDDRAPGGHELKANRFTLVGASHDFPIYESTVEAEAEDVLMDRRHLWLRSRKLTNQMIVKGKMLRAFREWFDQNGFHETTPSVITTNACEGGSTLFTFDYFGKEAYLSQSAQMYLEALAFSLEKVWCLTPSFRAEKSRTRKHLTEFGHLEEEAAWVDNEGNMDIQEQLVSHVARRVAETAEKELVELGREPADLKKMTTPFKRITYDDAVDLLKKRGFPDFQWGEDFGVPHEAALTQGEEKPIFVTYWPAEIKAFYMALDEDGVSARCADMIAPEGYGEIIGGSERSLDIDLMMRRLKKEGTDPTPYEWYFDLRRYGSVPHSGFGLGTERVLNWLTKGQHIRDATPFPRTPNRAYP